jgi:hypothetical protein
LHLACAYGLPEETAGRKHCSRYYGEDDYFYALHEVSKYIETRPRTMPANCLGATANHALVATIKDMVRGFRRSEATLIRVPQTAGEQDVNNN